MNESRGGAVAWLAHPVSIAATVVLLVNDHILKAAWPGLVTGKLSDVAGLVMAPPALAVALSFALPKVRPSWIAVAAMTTVGIGFTAVKASAAVAYQASTLWTVVHGPSIVRADLTDLLTLPALVIAWWVWRQVRSRPASPRSARRLAICVVLPLAGLAMAATSAAQYADAVSVNQRDGIIAVGIGDAAPKGHRQANYFLATEDGLNFTDPPWGYELADRPAEVSGSRSLACVTSRPGHCFRVVAGRLRVEETVDGGDQWRVAWEVTDADRRRLATTLPGLGDVEEYLSTRALVVLDQPDGGFVVLAVNGRDGFARRDTSGHWERIGFGIHDGSPSRVEPIPGWDLVTILHLLMSSIVAAVLAGAGVVLVALSVALIRVRSRWPVLVGLVFALPAAWVLVNVAGLVDDFFPLMSAAGWLVGLALLAMALIAMLAAALSLHAVTGRTAVLLHLLGFAVSLAVIAPFAADARIGWPSDPWVAVAVLLLVLAAVVLTLPFSATGRRLARWGPPPERE